MLNFDENMVRLLVLDEGYKQFPYKDTRGKLTIGIGWNIEDTGIEYDLAILVLKYQLNKLKTKLYTALPFFKGLNDTRQAVLIDMAFNLGISGLFNFKKTLQLIAEKKYVQASTEMLNSKWYSDVGKRAERLSEMMRTGLWLTY